jgi:hypothetical protein
LKRQNKSYLLLDDNIRLENRFSAASWRLSYRCMKRRAVALFSTTEVMSMSVPQSAKRTIGAANNQSHALN